MATKSTTPKNKDPSGHPRSICDGSHAVARLQSQIILYFGGQVGGKTKSPRKVHKTEPFKDFSGTPGGTRTPNIQNRNLCWYMIPPVSGCCQVLSRPAQKSSNRLRHKHFKNQL